MISRRRVLTTLCSATVSVPLFAQLARQTLAQQDTPRANLLLNFFPEGAAPELFFPAAGDVMSLPAMTTDLAPVIKDCTFIDGISLYGAAEPFQTSEYLLTGGSPNSLDNLIAARRSQQVPARPFNALRVGAYANRVALHSNSFAGGQRLAHEDSPVLAYGVLFGEGPSRVDALALSFLRETVGSQATEVIEQQLDGLASVAAKIPPLNLRGLEGDSDFSVADSKSAIAQVVDLQQDIIAMALSCGLSHCVSFMLGHEAWPMTPIEGDFARTLDYVNAGPDASIPYVRWYMQRLSNLIQKLKALPGQYGTSLLDETLVLTYSNTSFNAKTLHDRMPFILSGGQSFGHSGGYALDYRVADSGGLTDGQFHEAQSLGQPHTKLWVTIAQALGLSIEELGTPEAWGGLGAGVLPNFWQRGPL
jgi:hypothetical protein